MTVTTKKVSKPHQHEQVWVVAADGREIGLLVKIRDTRVDTHPYKAYLGIGAGSKLLGFYWTGPVPGHPEEKTGGRQAAIQAIVAAS